MKRRRNWLLGVALSLVLLVSLAVPALAVGPEPPPHSFYGTLTMDGSDILAPAEVVAVVEGGGGSIITSVDGEYGSPEPLGAKLVVKGYIERGDIIEFFVDGVKANETFPFKSGAITELDLTVPGFADTTPPSVTITELTPDPTNDNTPTFAGTATDTESNISSVEYKVDEGSWTAADAVDGAFDELSEDYTFTTSELLDGAHTVYVRATDTATNTTAEENYATDEFTVDATPPTVVSTTPEADETGVAIDAVVSATFSEDIQEGDNFGDIVITGATGVSASIDGATLTIAHDAFDPNTTYEVTIPAGAVNDLVGNPLAEAKVWSFTTPEFIPGDANGDGVVDVLDITKVARIILGLDAETPGADANGDGEVNVLDITKIARIILGLD